MYYDRTNSKQTQASPDVLQTTQRNIPLPSTQNVQDVRFVDSGKKGIFQTTLYVDIAFPEDNFTQVALPTLVVTRGGAKIIPPPYPDQEDAVSLESSTPNSAKLHSSEGSPHFSDLQTALEKAAKEVRLD